MGSTGGWKGGNRDLSALPYILKYIPMCNLSKSYLNLTKSNANAKEFCSLLTWGGVRHVTFGRLGGVWTP